MRLGRGPNGGGARAGTGVAVEEPQPSAPPRKAPLDPRGFTYSVVIPVFNSEPLVGTTIDRTVAFFEAQGFSYEIVLVNDGSTDDSWEVLREAVDRHTHVRGSTCSATTASTTPTSAGSVTPGATTSSRWTTTCRTRPKRSST